MKRRFDSSLVARASASAACCAQVNVPYERIVNSAEEPGNWLTYGGNYVGPSPLDARPDHAGERRRTSSPRGSIRRARRASGRSRRSSSTASSTSASGRTSSPRSTVARAGRSGTTAARCPTDVAGCCGPVNRGLAILGDALYFATFDCHFVCLDANTGKERWDMTRRRLQGRPLDDARAAGGEGQDHRRHLRRRVRHPRIPRRVRREDRQARVALLDDPRARRAGQRDLGQDSDIWKKGGGATWVTGTYDPELNTLYWTTGNPGPDYNGDVRPGDNLYTCCVLALDPDTGKLQVALPVHAARHARLGLEPGAGADRREIDGKPRKLLVQANRNAFFYVLDRDDRRVHHRQGVRQADLGRRDSTRRAGRS